MAQRPYYRVQFDLSEAEVRALHRIIDYPFVGDTDDLAGIVGSHHKQLETARRLHEKVLAAIAHADRRSTK